MKLEEIFLSKTRAEILRQLFGLQGRELHLRALQRGSGLSAPAIRQELLKLTKLDLLIVRKDSNRHYYKANVNHPLYHDMRSLVLKTSGLAEVLSEALKHKEVKVAFVFGSFALDEETSQSDIDLMVIGDASLRKVVGWLSGKAEQTGREINPHVMTASEFKRRLKQREHFLVSVLESPRLLIVGNEDDLAELGK
jgi:predicted nucleotidyltransferase